MNGLSARIILTIFLMLLSINTFSQNYFPIWTFHQRDINIHGISVGLWSLNSKPRHTNTNGIKFELIGVGLGIPLIPQSPIVETDSALIAFQQEYPLSERINGLNLSTSGTLCDCLTNGLTAGFVGQINFQVNGVSASVFMNFNQVHNGIMIACFNEAYSMNGLQVGFSNNGYKTKGIQLGIIGNESEEMKGLQIGIYNKSEKHKGLQIGLWNVNQKRKLPLINWSFR